MSNQDKMRKLLEAIDFAGEPQQKPGEYSTGVKKPESKGKFLGKPYKREEHPDQNKLVGESEGEEVEESPATELNQATAKARLPDRGNPEQRGVWQQHYQRALRNGRDDRAARRYADSMTGSESKFQIEGELDEGKGLCHGCYVRDKEDPSQEVFKMRGDPDDRNVWIGDSQGRGWYVHASRLVKVRDGDPGIDEYFGDEDLEESQDSKSQANYTDEELEGIKLYVQDDYSFRDLGTYPGLIKKIRMHLEIPYKSGFEGEMEFNDAVCSAMNQGEFGGLKEADVALDIAEPDKPKSVYQTPGLSPAARALAAKRQLAQMDKEDALSAKDQRVADLNKPTPQFNSRDFDVDAALVEAMTKAYEDYVSNEKYDADTIYPKKSQKPTADKKKVKALKVVDPNRVDEEVEKCPECHGSGQDREQGGRCQKCDGSGNAPVKEMWADQIETPASRAEDRAWERRFKKMQAKKKAEAAKKKEKPFKDAAATGNPRDFANEGKGKDPFAGTQWNEKAVKAKQLGDYKKRTGLDKEAPKDPKTVNKDGKTMYEARGPSKEQVKANDAEWAKIEAHWKKLHGKDVQMPGGPAGDQRMRNAWNKSKKK